MKKKLLIYSKVFIIFLILSTLSAVIVRSASNDLLGYGWSDTIGWLSMSASTSPAYQVTLNTDGTLLGYAWSDSVGWIQFGGLSGFPVGTSTVSANARVDLVTGKVTGWARAIAGCQADLLDAGGNCTGGGPGNANGTSLVPTAQTTIDFSTTNWVTNTNAGSRYWYSITSSDNGLKLAAVDYGAPSTGGGYVYTSIDGGVTWTARTTAGQRYWAGIVSSSDGLKLTAIDSGNSAGGYIYTSADGGATWIPRTSSGLRVWQSVTSSSDGTKIVAGASPGYLYRSTDNGATWTSLTGAPSANWGKITSSADGVKLVALQGPGPGTIYTSANSGNTWTARTVAGSRYWAAVTSSADGNKIVAGVANGYLYTSADAGATWATSTAAGARYWQSIASSDDGTKIIAGVYPYGNPAGEYIYTSTNSGATWTAQSSAGSRFWQAVTISSDGSRMNAAVYPSGGYIYTGTYGTTTTSVMATGNSGWDGWISLSGYNYESPVYNGTRGVTYSTTTGAFTGYAWGSDVIGWLSLNLVTTVNGTSTPPVILPPPLCTSFLGAPTAINLGSSFNLRWVTTNAVSCTVKDGLNYTYSTATTSPLGITITPAGTLTYRLLCTNTNLPPDTCSQTTTVTVGAPPAVTQDNSGLWLNNDPAKRLASVTTRANKVTKVNWDITGLIGSGYTACTENVSSATQTLGSWVNNAILPASTSPNSAPRISLTNLPVGSHTLFVQCSDPTNTLSPVSSTTNNVRINVLPASIQED